MMTIFRSRKVCHGCGKAKPIGAFYADQRMSDGHLNQCKECRKSYAKQHRLDTLETCREYDRKRSRTLNRLVYARAAERRRKLQNPEKYKARTKLNNALRDGKIKRWPCERCGARAEAHHPDYSKPLDVRWLCKEHHEQEHH